MSAAARLAVLISGNGSNLQALIDAITAGELDARIVLVISNVPDAPGLTRARAAGIATQVIDHRNYSERILFDEALAEAITPYAVDLVILAGFMRILSAGFIRAFADRLINIHPSLLPNYPGLDTHQQAIDNGDRAAGATVHFVSTELDSGPAIIHAATPVENYDTASSLAARVRQLEHQILPLAVQWCCSGRVAWRDNQALLDNKTLPPGGWRYVPVDQTLRKKS